MKKSIIYILFTFFTLAAFAQDFSAGPGTPPPGNGKPIPGDKNGPKNGKKPDEGKKSKKKSKKEPVQDVVEGKVPGKVYVFGCSFEFGDSLVYITDINEVDSLVVTKKNKFLPYRSDFSLQFKDKLESKAYGLKNQTTSVYYSGKKDKLVKALAKMRKKLITDQGKQIVDVPLEKFNFVHPLDYFGLPSE